MTGRLLPRKKGYWFEELDFGHVMETNGATVTEDAILRYALEWDPQPFHLDREAAAASAFGGLVASGLHTLNIAYRLFYDSGCLRDTVIAGVGLGAMRFPRPVRPGDTLRVRATVTEKSEAPKKGRGRVVFLLQAMNGAGELVLETSLITLVACRAPAGDGA